MTNQLPKPTIDARHFGAHRLCVLTDDALFAACGVRIGFTSRAGGVSTGPYAALNLYQRVNDDAACVDENRRRLLCALGADDAYLMVPNQVHGTQVVSVDSGEESNLRRFQAVADEGADALAIGVPRVAALLNFADCAPVIVVSPTGRFVVAHAGWRGAVAGIAGKAARSLAALDAAAGDDADCSRFNAYIGPHIRSECFEVGPEVVAQFVEAFGAQAAPDANHVSLAAAVTTDLTRAGLVADRIADAQVCTKCSSEDYFSYRASGGVCGRHGAIAFREGNA